MLLTAGLDGGNTVNHLKIIAQLHILLTQSRYRDIVLVKGVGTVPVLSRFYGIIIRMYFQQSEHNPPHIHAIYGEHVAAIDIKTRKVLEGYLPGKAMDMVREWMELHEDALVNIWETQNFVSLPPLE